MINFIYLAHSKERFRKQTRYSILTLLGFINNSLLDFRIIVYTDDETLFADLDVRIEHTNDQLIAEWMGPQQFVHRAKVLLMRDLLVKYDGHVVFLDSDNCIFKDPSPVLEKLDKGFAIMDKAKYILDKPADKLGKKYSRFFRKHPVIKLENRQIKVGMNFTVWNSGCIGIPEGKREIVNEVLPVCDYLHSKFPKHLSEQLAYGIIISRHMEIQPFSEYSYHWFGHGQAINQVINDLFDKCNGLPLADQIALIAGNRGLVLNAPPNPDKRKKWYQKIFN